MDLIHRGNKVIRDSRARFSELWWCCHVEWHDMVEWSFRNRDASIRIIIVPKGRSVNSKSKSKTTSNNNKRNITPRVLVSFGESVVCCFPFAGTRPTRPTEPAPTPKNEEERLPWRQSRWHSSQLSFWFSFWFWNSNGNEYSITHGIFSSFLRWIRSQFANPTERFSHTPPWWWWNRLLRSLL